ncbi:uncharacterized protein At3g49140-like isoform X2 [Tripterygium wilfordii]|uniref:uncharacterized protein At3g49140-like isoform X2 n=1 Tax=Tripterygium wilfordii TaxID=458696 RepID=UPI0018F7F98D|nr:uncharacterized protein At3g49140-like isoform X2 [Tripterygium wilfordii]
MLLMESAMAVRFPAGVDFCSSTALPHCRSMWSSDEITGVAVPSRRSFHSGSCHVPWSRLRRLMGSSVLRKSSLLLRKSIRASTEYLGSAPDPAKQNRRQSYHPFEDIAESTSENCRDVRLTAAEATRTIIEVNNKASVMFTDLINDEIQENVVLPELPYVKDEHGNIYFQVKNDEDNILQTLTSENNFVDWVAVLQDEDDEDDSDSDETLGDWAKLETMRYSHPMSFAKTLAQVASYEPIDWMEKPPAGLAIQGIIRPALIDEHSDIQKHMSGSYSRNPDINQVVDEKLDDFGAFNGEKQESQPLKDGSIWSEESMKDEIPRNGTSFYKLEMIKLELISVQGHQTVEVDDFRKAQPDAIAHSAAKIISRLKAGGEKITQAFKSLCWRCKGIQVEEAAIIGVDSLGFDLRVCSGTQIQTLRFPFSTRATSEYGAERQLNDLLFPRIHHNPLKKKQTLQNEV